jgi:hypothetical protein
MQKKLFFAFVFHFCFTFSAALVFVWRFVSASSQKSDEKKNTTK